MKNRKIITTLSSFLLLSSVICHPTSVYAAPVGLSIDPSLLKVQIKPGKSITKVFKIENTESVDKNVVARVVPFNKSDNLGNPVIDLKSKAPWLSYINLSNANIKLDEPFLLKAKSSEQLILSLAIPETANLEDLYVSLLVSTYDNIVSSDQKGTLISATIGSNILVSVTSGLNPPTLLKINKFYPTSGNFIKIGRRYLADNLTPMTFTASAQNDGLFITETKGTFKVTKKADIIHLQGILPQYIISKNSRTLINTEGKPFSFTPTLNNIGQHSLNIDIKSENSNTSNSIEIIFLPIKALLGLSVTLIILRIIFTKKKSD
jgi:hypothetical protein